MAWDPNVQHPIHPDTPVQPSLPNTKGAEPSLADSGEQVAAAAEEIPSRIGHGIPGEPVQLGDIHFGDEFERLKTRLHEMNLRDQELRELEDEIASQDNVIANLEQELKDAKDSREELIANLRHAVRRRRAAGKQKELPYDESNGQQPANDGTMSAKNVAAHVIEPVADIAASMPIAELHAPEGYTEKMVEAGITTVGELEKRIGAGEFLPSAIKGIGQTAIDKITDCLVNFRNDHPVPTTTAIQAATEDDQAVIAAYVGKCRQHANTAVGLIAKLGDVAAGYAKELTAMGNMIESSKSVPESMVARIAELGETLEKATATA
jgi:hypothetical protein